MSELPIPPPDQNKSKSNHTICVFHLSLYTHVFYVQFCFNPTLTTSPGFTLFVVRTGYAPVALSLVL